MVVSAGATARACSARVFSRASAGRTWAFAVLFAQRDRIAHAVEGARAAHELLCRHGEAEDRAAAVAEAITLHLNVSVPERLGAEAHLLSKGVSLDTVGRGLDRLPRARVGDVNGRWPREGFAEHLVSATGRQAKIRPQSRSALLDRLGFAGLLLANPLDRRPHTIHPSS
jgi:hypothetical protein